jgi:hypothetical protein
MLAEDIAEQRIGRLAAFTSDRGCGHRKGESGPASGWLPFWGRTRAAHGTPRARFFFSAISGQVGIQRFRQSRARAEWSAARSQGGMV